MPSFYKSLRFRGVFSLPLTGEVAIKLWNHDGYSIETEWFWRGITGWEAASIQIWMKLCASRAFGPAPVIGDIGACEGIYALVARALLPGARVLAVEPLAEACQRLNANILLNKQSMDVFQAACSDRDGTAELFVDGQTTSTEASIVTGRMSHPSASRVVATRAMSSLIEELDLRSVDLIKVDVEGAEPEVLKGMGKYLKEFRPVMILEVLTPEAAEQLNELMAPLNYSYWDINDDPRNGALGLKPANRICKGVCLNWLIVPTEKVEPLEKCWSDWYLS